MSTYAESPQSRLLKSFDCTQDYGPEEYLEYQPTRVVDSPAGRYREAGDQMRCRFAYRFQIEQVGHPHLVVVRYPDDKQRHFGLSDGMGYDMDMGVYTGFALPLSNEMHEARLLFYPRWNDCAVQIATWGTGEPAAAARVEVWELADDAPLPVPADPGDGSRRVLGSQWEDPCGYAMAEGALDHTQWTEHVLAYAQHSGQNVIQPIMCWYYGPQFPSETNYSDNTNLLATPDHKLWARTAQQPADWWQYLLRRATEEGVGVVGALSLIRLSSLLEGMNIDLESIYAGADTYNNMLYNNRVQSAIQDWTGDYNALMMHERFDSIRAEGGGKLWRGATQPWGERHDEANHSGPMFNPLHPVTQEKVLALVQEILDRYAHHASFKGISLNLFNGSVLWFGSLHAGYDDYTVRLFEQETGIKVPGDPQGPERFARRYEFLSWVARPAWTAWRCRKVAQWIGKLRDTLVAARPDLRLTVTVWQETLITFMLGALSEALQLGARPALRQLLREGIDLELLAGEPGLEFDVQLGDARDRATWGHMGLDAPLEYNCMFRDFNFLDQDTLDAFAGVARPGAFIFNCYAEDWPDTIAFAADPAEVNYAAAADMDGKPAADLVRMNCLYPEDGWWFESQLRIYTPFPTGPHYREPLAHAVAELDAGRITQGGLFMDRCHTEELRRFALAYRALPQQKFETVGATTDPVAVRTLVADGQRYFYLVNREYYPVRVTVAFGSDPGSVMDLATGESLPVGQTWEVTLEPYGLRSCAVPPAVEVAGFTSEAPASVVAELAADAARALEQIARLGRSGKFVAGLEALGPQIPVALAEGRIAWLRKALTSYPVRKCRELLQVS